MSEKKVVVYSQPGCSECKVAKEFLSQKGIAFEEKNIREDAQAIKELTEKYKSRSTPTIVVGEKVMIGFNKEELERIFV